MSLETEVVGTCPICEKPVLRNESRTLIGGTNVGGKEGAEMIDQDLAHKACVDGEAPGGALFSSTEPLTPAEDRHTNAPRAREGIIGGEGLANRGSRKGTPREWSRAKSGAEQPAEIKQETEPAALFEMEADSSLDAVLGLAHRYLVPPFTILDRRQGYWQERGRQWKGLGIESELGRTAMGGGPTEGVQGPMQGGGNLLQSIEREAETQAENRQKAEDAAREEAGLPERTKSRGERSVATMNHLVPNHLAREASIFDPVLCEVAYTWFCPNGGKILDPFAGGSVRGVIAGALGHPYVGIDLSAQQVEANREQAERIFEGSDGERTIKPRWITGDSRDVLPKGQERYDFVFSCPPYGDLEVYSDDPKDISTMLPDDFDAAYAEIIGKAVTLMADDSFAAFVVGNYRIDGILRDLCGITVDAFQRAGAGYYNEVITIDPVGTAAVRVGTMFRASRKLARVHQQLLVFVKGDPKKATAKLPRYDDDE